MIAPYLLVSILAVVCLAVFAGMRLSRSWQSARQVIAEAEREVAEWAGPRQATWARSDSPREPVRGLARTPSLTR